MRKTVILPLAAAAALVLTSCGQEPTTGQPPAEEPSASQPQEPGDGAREPEEKSPDAFEERASQLAADWPDVEPIERHSVNLWRLGGAERPDDTNTTRFTVHVEHGACDADHGTWLHETADLVIVSGWAQPDQEVENCVEMLMVDEVEVELENELGDRTVVDAASGLDLFGEEFAPGR